MSKPTGMRLLGRPKHSRRAIIKWIFKKFVSIRGIEFIQLRIAAIGDPF